MRVSPDGNVRFTRQENGQVFADGNEQKHWAVFGSGSRHINPLAIKLSLRSSSYIIS